MLYHWMLTQHLSLVHLHHTLNHIKITPVTFYHEAAPLILLSTGEDSVKGTPFFTYIINFMQFKYIYSSAYFSIRFAYILYLIPCGLIRGSPLLDALSTRLLPTKMAGNGSHPDPKLHGFLLVLTYTAIELFSLSLCTYRRHA